MKTYHWNGERWYINRRSALRRAVDWLAWFGGAGLDLPLKDRLFPTSLLGHRITFYGHWLDVRTPWGVLVVKFKRDERGKVQRTIDEAYLSHDGTPGQAHAWIVGAPREVVRAVEGRVQA